MMATEPSDVPAGYGALRHGAAWAELPERSIVLATGPDAVAFVDRFTTASLAPLSCGRGTEGMFCDARGHVLAVTTILRVEDGLEIDAGPAPRVSLADHLEHYHIRERLEFRDASSALTTFLVAGPAAADWLAARLGAAPMNPCDHQVATVGGATVRVVHGDAFTGSGFLVRSAAADAPAVRGWLTDGGLALAGIEAIETVRIEARAPQAVDMPEKTLPQELDLPSRAISFTKGCYLGQETVARLDALGHVNRTLALVACDGPPPPPGTVVLADGEPAGTITSSCHSPAHAAALAMAVVHRRAAVPTTRLSVDGRRGRLVSCPAMKSPDTGAR